MSESSSRTVATLQQDDNDRVVIHFDLDAFYVACERELNESLRGVPVGVSQYNPHGKLQEKASHEVERRLVKSPNSNFDKEDCNGSLIAVSYEARAAGVRRNDRGVAAVQKCPELRIVQVPVKYGKADLTMYRSASSRVMEVLSKSLREQAQTYSSSSSSSWNKIPVEIASIDEVYMDVTKAVEEMAVSVCQCENVSRWNQFVKEAANCTTIGGLEVLSGAAEATNALNKDDLRRGSHLQVLDSSAHQTVDEGSRTWWTRDLALWTNVEIRLACGAFLASKAREAVLNAFRGGVFTLSAGISNNKTLAKLASGLKKPHRQTLINRTDTNGALEKLFHPLPLGRIRGLGGKFGDQVSTKLNISTVGQLAEVPLTTLQSTLGGDVSTAKFLHDIARGICRDEVTERTRVKSISCGKTFSGNLAIASTDIDACRKWTGELCSELTERISVDQEEHSRFPTVFVVHVTVRTNGQRNSASKSCRAPRKLTAYSEAALQLVSQLLEAAKSGSADSSTFGEAPASIFITGMSMGVSSFVDMAAGSSSIIAAFQRVSNKENVKTVHRQEAQCSKNYDAVQLRSPSPANVVTPNNVNAMDKWLSSQTAVSHTACRKSDPNDVDSTRTSREKAGPMLRYLGVPTTVPRRSRNTTSTSSGKRPLSVALPTMEEIDPAVLDALPHDIRISLLEDLASQDKPKKRRGTITAFLKSS